MSSISPARANTEFIGIKAEQHRHIIASAGSVQVDDWLRKHPAINDISRTGGRVVAGNARVRNVL